MFSIRGWLTRAPTGVFAAYAMVASFATYFCMYFYRRPFAVATFEGATVLGLDAKSAFVIAQALGYFASKFLGIKVVSEMTPERRARALLLCIGCAEAALVLFAVLPPGLAAIAIALNGLSLGMVWGMVFGFLEGRKTSDLLGAALCVSFIVASGYAKGLGKAILDRGVAEAWMPAAAGLIVAVPMLASVFLLSRIPPPTKEDAIVRTERVPMDRAARSKFFREHALGLVLLVIAYVCLTTLRDFRDNFAREIWTAVGYADTPSTYGKTELPVAFGSLLAVAAIFFIASNRRAVLAIHGLLLLGGVTVGVAMIAHKLGAIGPVTWMIAIGLGLYVAYVPYNCVLFDRLVAASGSKANAGFLIYVADASGYGGSVATLIYKNIGQKNLSWVSFLHTFGLVSSAIIVVAVTVSAVYFARTMRKE